MGTKQTLKTLSIMKESTFCAVLSIAITGIGMLLAFGESWLLVNHGASPEIAFIDSLYTGFLGWVILAALLTSTDWFWKLSNKIIKK